jgi:CMP-N,N'-diacetyllegionaminic acid synthase
MKKKIIYAVTPARGNSKGIKNKNLKSIKNKSLLKICFDAAKETKLIDEIVISSDSSKIIRKAKSIGYKVYFKRPKNLSGDKIADMPVIKHALIQIEKNIKKKIDYLVMLQVTSPLRKPEHIKKCIKKILENKLDAIWTISKVDKKYHPDKQLIIKNNEINFFSRNGKNIIARQQLQNTYYRNGAVYVFSRKAVLNEKILPKKSGFIITKEELISIDTKQDLKRAEQIISFSRAK